MSSAQQQLSTESIGWYSELAGRLRSVNGLRRMLALVTGVAVVGLVAALAALCLIATGGLLDPGPAARTILLAVAGGALGYALIRHLLLRCIGRQTVRGAASMVETHYGGYRNNLVSTVDVHTRETSQTSVGFAAALTQATWQESQGKSFPGAVPKGLAMKSAALCILAGAVLFGVASKWPDEVKNQWQRYSSAPEQWWKILNRREIHVVFDKLDKVVLSGEPSGFDISLELKGRGFNSIDVYVKEDGSDEETKYTLQALNEELTQFRYKKKETIRTYYVQVRFGHVVSEVATVRAVDRPKIVALWLEYIFPQYTEYSSVRTRQKNGRIQAIFGTYVNVTIKANVELSTAYMRVNGADIAMRLPGSYAKGRFRVEQNGFYELHLTSTDGFKNLPVKYSIKADRDRLPTVRILNFESDEVVVEIGDQGFVPVEMEAKDNEGVRRLEIAYEMTQLPDEGFRVLEKKGALGVQLYDPPRQSVHETVVGFLDELPLEVGDVVTFMARVVDSCMIPDPSTPEPEPHVVYSRPIRIVIVAPDLKGLNTSGNTEWTMAPTKGAGRRKDKNWLKDQIERQKKKGVLASDGAGGKRERPLEVNTTPPGIRSADSAPTGMSGEVSDYFGGD